MSSDETDHDALKPQYLIHRRLERSKEFTIFLRDLDVLHIIRTHYDSAGNRLPGNFPNDRFESRIRSLAAPIPALPQACYNAIWLASLRSARYPEAESHEEVDLKVNYDSELTYKTLCLPQSLQE